MQHFNFQLVLSTLQYTPGGIPHLKRTSITPKPTHLGIYGIPGYADCAFFLIIYTEGGFRALNYAPHPKKARAPVGDRMGFNVFPDSRAAFGMGL